MPGCLTTIFWSSLVGIVSVLRTSSPESSWTEGKPLLSGVSDTNINMMVEPITPAMAENMKPYSQPINATTSPRAYTEMDLPRYGVALRML